MTKYQGKDEASHLYSSTIKLKDVIDIDFLQQFQDNFAKGVGVASVTVDPDGIPITNPSSYTRFCKGYTHSKECGDKRCAESHRKGGEEAARTGKPVVYECHAGLIDFAAPIIIDGQLIGTILGGQVLTDDPNEAKYRQIAKEIGLDEDGYVEAVQEVKVMSRESIEAAAMVLFIVANNLSNTAYQQQQKLKNEYDKLVIIGEEVLSAIEEVYVTSENLSAQSEELSATAKNMDSETARVLDDITHVNSIASTIKKISAQSNILGINASIESARAGEHGLGFKVVAEEVRKLAEHTKGSAANIEEDIKRVQTSVNSLIGSVEQLAVVSESQAIGVTELTKALGYISQLAEKLVEMGK